MTTSIHPEYISEIFLTRREAAAYLLKKYGNPGAIAPSTLGKLAVIGGGPTLHHFGRKVGYRPSDLDAWVLARCSVPHKNTSDKGGHSNE